jgi:4-hydroxy-L-threonine phosphate dehydrogenase PdxA
MPKILSSNIISKPAEAHSRRINLINCVPESFVPSLEVIPKRVQKLHLIALEAAVKDLKNGTIDVLITAPFNKSGVSKEGFSFPGHTEYLTKIFSVDESLCLWSPTH